MGFISTIRKPNNTITWSKQEPVQTQYFTTQLSTLTYSTTGVMSSTTQGTFTTTAQATTISSNVSYSYQEGNIYSTSMTSTTIALPDGRTATSFGTMTTELKYSYYPNRRQTGEKYVAVNSNYVGNIYSTLASSTRSSCILFGGNVNSTINTYRSSVYTPAYILTASTYYTTTSTSFSRPLFYMNPDTTVTRLTYTQADRMTKWNGQTQVEHQGQLLFITTSSPGATIVRNSWSFSHRGVTKSTYQFYTNFAEFHISDVKNIGYTAILSDAGIDTYTYSTSWESFDNYSLITSSSDYTNYSDSTVYYSMTSQAFDSPIMSVVTTLNTTALVTASTTAQTTTETSVYSTVESNFTYYLFYNTTNSTVKERRSLISNSNGIVETRPAELLVLNGARYFDNNKFTLTSGDIFYSNETTTLVSTQPSSNYFHISDVSAWTVTLHRYFKKGSSLISFTDSFVQSDFERSYIGSTLDTYATYTLSISTIQYTNRVNTVTYRTNAWVNTSTTTTAQTSTSAISTSLVIPDFDGKISAHHIADSMYYSLRYTYPFTESKTSYILHSDSITHQYYRSTTKEVTV